MDVPGMRSQSIRQLISAIAISACCCGAAAARPRGGTGLADAEPSSWTEWLHPFERAASSASCP